MYNINHRTILDKEKVIDLYTQKDGVPISYVCTTELENDNVIIDIFFRSTPHPEFKNRYFGLFRSRGTFETVPPLLIRAADNVEEYIFDMIESEGQWHYSRARHDCLMTSSGGIDGGRNYTRIIGSKTGMPTRKSFVVRDGVFVEHQPLEKI